MSILCHDLRDALDEVYRTPRICRPALPPPPPNH